MLVPGMTFRKALQEIVPPELPCNKQTFSTITQKQDVTVDKDFKFLKSESDPSYHKTRNHFTSPLIQLQDDWLQCNETLSEDNFQFSDTSFMQRQYELFCNDPHNAQRCSDFCQANNAKQILLNLLESQTSTSFIEGWCRIHPSDASLSLQAHMRDTVFSWMRDVS